MLQHLIGQQERQRGVSRGDVASGQDETRRDEMFPTVPDRRGKGKGKRQRGNALVERRTRLVGGSDLDLHKKGAVRTALFRAVDFFPRPRRERGGQRPFARRFAHWKNDDPATGKQWRRDIAPWVRVRGTGAYRPSSRHSSNCLRLRGRRRPLSASSTSARHTAFSTGQDRSAPTGQRKGERVEERTDPFLEGELVRTGGTPPLVAARPFDQAELVRAIRATVRG